MCQKQSLPIIIVLYCYNYASLILDEIIKMSVNSGHYNQSNIALTLHDVDHEWGKNIGIKYIKTEVGIKY
jgi:hypothetical protein